MWCSSPISRHGRWVLSSACSDFPVDGTKTSLLAPEVDMAVLDQSPPKQEPFEFSKLQFIIKLVTSPYRCYNDPESAQSKRMKRITLPGIHGWKSVCHAVHYNNISSEPEHIDILCKNWNQERSKSQPVRLLCYLWICLLARYLNVRHLEKKFHVLQSSTMFTIIEKRRWCPCF